MKAKIIIQILFLSVLISSCKDKQETKLPLTDKPIQKVKENFNVEVDLKASKKDDFSLYYTEDGTINFSSEMAIWRGVSGENKRETIIFNLSEEMIPTDIRLDFGMNKEQDSVTVYKVEVSYYGNEFSFNGTDFFKYFIESKDFKTEFDVPNSALKIVKNGPEYKTPFYYPRQELIDAIKKITTKK